jgi:hypothetical protein
MWIILKREEKSRIFIHKLTALFMFLRTKMIILLYGRKETTSSGQVLKLPSHENVPEGFHRLMWTDKRAINAIEKKNNFVGVQ